VAAAFAIGLLLRVMLLATSVGSSDVAFKTLWAETTLEHGIAKTYTLNKLANHPPFSFLILRECGRLARDFGIPVGDSFRAVQVLADMITALLLLWIGKRTGRGAELAVAFLLVPAAIFISAFHCNSDPTMVMFLTAAVALFLAGRTAASGAMTAVAAGIKIVPLLLLPLFAAAARRRVVTFSAAWAVAMAVLFVPTFLSAGTVLIRNIFGYAGFPGEWGVVALMRILAVNVSESLIPLARWYVAHGKWVALAVMLGLVAARWAPRRALDVNDLLRGVPLLLLVLLVLAPGFGVQYLVWPLPLLPLLLGRRGYLAVAGAISVFLFYTYTLWSDGFPWWFANADNHYPSSLQYLLAGLVLWLVLAAATVAGARRFLRAE
jgi:hypothetical protein